MSGPSRISRREALVAALGATSVASAVPTEAANKDVIDVTAEKMNAYQQKPLLTVSVTLPSGQSMQLKATQLRVIYNGVHRFFVDRNGPIDMPPIPKKLIARDQPST